MVKRDLTQLQMRHGRIGFGLMDKSQHSRSDNIIDDVLLLTYSSCYDSNSLLTFKFKYKFQVLIQSISSSASFKLKF